MLASMRFVVLMLALVLACASDDDGGTDSGGTDSGHVDSGGTDGSADADGADADRADVGVDSGRADSGGGSCVGDERSGEATYYTFADGTGNCGFPATPSDLMVGAMNHTDYSGSAACGSCARITGPDGTITVRIVDRCPECPAGDIDLSTEAFEMISPLSAGRVPITWSYVPCDVSGTVVYHFAEGSNQWWTAVQVRNHRHAIARFEYRAEDGSFVEVSRVDYNYFVHDSGMGPGPHTFRVTDVHGNVIMDTGIPLLDDADAPGGSQFPFCD